MQKLLVELEGLKRRDVKLEMYLKQIKDGGLRSIEIEKCRDAIAVARKYLLTPGMDGTVAVPLFDFSSKPVERPSGEPEASNQPQIDNSSVPPDVFKPGATHRMANGPPPGRIHHPPTPVCQVPEVSAEVMMELERRASGNQTLRFVMQKVKTGRAWPTEVNRYKKFIAEAEAVMKATERSAAVVAANVQPASSSQLQKPPAPEDCRGITAGLTGKILVTDHSHEVVSELARMARDNFALSELMRKVQHVSRTGPDVPRFNNFVQQAKDAVQTAKLDESEETASMLASGEFKIHVTTPGLCHLSSIDSSWPEVAREMQDLVNELKSFKRRDSKLELYLLQIKTGKTDGMNLQVCREAMTRTRNLIFDLRWRDTAAPLGRNDVGRKPELSPLADTLPNLPSTIKQLESAWEKLRSLGWTDPLLDAWLRDAQRIAVVQQTQGANAHANEVRLILKFAAKVQQDLALAKLPGKAPVRFKPLASLQQDAGLEASTVVATPQASSSIALQLDVPSQQTQPSEKEPSDPLPSPETLVRRLEEAWEELKRV